ncbi:MAG: prenyltransferase [Acidimicrobiia bacterium]
MMRPRFDLPDLAGVISADEVRSSAATIAALQHPSGMIPWFTGGHCDPWNHVETAMALDVAGLHTEAEHAYRWLAATQLPTGAWHNYYVIDPDHRVSVKDHKFDSNTIAYLATGLWHHQLATGDTTFLAEMFPVLQRAMDFVLALQTPRGEIIWARHHDGTPWSYALLTGSSSICHALRCACAIAERLDDVQPEWELAAVNLARVIRHVPDAFEPKTRWAMDWYYPVLSGALTPRQARRRLAGSWSTFVMDGLGVCCVSDEPWVTAAETAECALAHVIIGERDIARELLACTRLHRIDDGSYLTGIVYPGEITFPDQERSAYSAAAVILAADAWCRATPASCALLDEDLPTVIEIADIVDEKD